MYILFAKFIHNKCIRLSFISHVVSTIFANDLPKMKEKKTRKNNDKMREIIKQEDGAPTLKMQVQ